MRIDIKTKIRTRDRDIRALLILNEGIKRSTPRMAAANLLFIASKYGYRLIRKTP